MYYGIDTDLESYGMRPVDKNDLALLAHHRNSIDTWSNLTQSLPVALDKQMDWLDSLGKNAYYFINFCIKRNASSAKNVGLTRVTDIDWQNRNCAIGVDTYVQYRNQGWGKKFFNLATKWAFEELNMHRLWLMVLDDNIPARRIYEDAGFQYEGVLRQHIYRHGKWHDYLLMGKINV